MDMFNEKQPLISNYIVQENYIIINESCPIIINNDDGIGLIKSSKRKNLRETIIQHPYLKEVLLVLFLYSISLMCVSCYSLFKPLVILQYVEKRFPDYDEKQIQSEAAYYKSLLDSIPFVLEFFLGPFIGVLSDRYGRKFPLYVGCFVQLLDMISCYITARTNCIIPFFIGHICGGLYIVIVPAIYAYLSDLTDSESLSTIFILPNAALGFSSIVGPLFIYISTLFPDFFFLELYIGFIGISIVIIFFLKESLTIAKQNNKIDTSEKKSNPFVLAKNVFSTSPYISLIMMVFILSMFCYLDGTTYYYSTTLRYGWDTKHQSFFMIYSGLMTLIWSLFGIPFFLKYYSERKIISSGLLIGCISRIIYSFAFNQWMWVGASIFGSFLTQCHSLIRSLVSNSSPPEIQGTVLSGVQSISAFTCFFGALALGNVYSFSISKKSPIYFPGATYFLTSLILLISFIVSLLIWKKYSNPHSKIKQYQQQQQQQQQQQH